MLCLDQEADDAGDREIVESRYAASLGLVKEEHVGPDLDGKDDTLRFAPGWSSCFSRRTRALLEGSTTRSHPDSRASRISVVPGRSPPCSTTSCQTAGGMTTSEKRWSRLIRPISERWMSGEELLTASGISDVPVEVLVGVMPGDLPCPEQFLPLPPGHLGKRRRLPGRMPRW